MQAVNQNYLDSIYNKYSVLMSVYFKEKADYFQASVESMLKQTICPSDFVIVCDGPVGEDIHYILNEYKKKYSELFQIIYLTENKGLGHALNIGLNYCKYELVARMDSDDIACYDRVEKQIKALVENNLDVVSGTIIEFINKPGDLNIKREVPIKHKEIQKFISKRNPINHPCVMFKRSSVIKAGNYQGFYLLEDYYLWVRMLKKGALFGNVGDVLLYMRVGNGMYNRRTGWKYICSFSKLHWYIKKAGMCSLIEYMLVMCGVCILTIMPNEITKLFYKTILRKKNKISFSLNR